MNIILFGPPGIGKSTLIALLKSTGHRAIDLEDMYPSSVRFQMPNYLSHIPDTVFLGAADLAPNRPYPNARTVLLSATQKVYDDRRRARDQMHPGKAAQKHHSVDDWDSVKYDFVLDTSNLTLADTMQALLLYAEGGDGNANPKTDVK